MPGYEKYMKNFIVEINNKPLPYLNLIKIVVDL